MPEAWGSTGDAAIVVLPTPAAVALSAAERVADALSDAVSKRGRADWATTGGSSPIGIYRELAQAPLRDAVPWRAVHVWWGDDRYVPRDHPLSNVLPLDEILLRRAPEDLAAGFDPGAPIPVANLHVIPMDAAIGLDHDPGWAAKVYERELREAPLAHSPTGIPILDVVLVGAGADGHVLSVFPDSRVFDSGAWVAGIPAPTHIEPRVPRVSLNPAFLAAARLSLVIITGQAKAAMVGEVLGPERDPLQWPIQHARRANAVWLLDEAAAAQIQR